jgi:chemotaxis family two-component system response regulator Rcp1
MSTLSARGRPAEVLLVEDNDDDAELARIALGQATFAVKLHRVTNGEECMAFLRKEGVYTAAPVPDLILLDLNMPRMDGREVLHAIGADDALRHLPVVVLTTSAADEDVIVSYRLGCRSYIVKPPDFGSFAKAIRGLTDYWFSLVVLASRS